MQKIFRAILLLAMILAVGGCNGYRAYLGSHGKSVRLHPDVHESSFTTDRQCLECHHPDHSQGPSSPHPGFKGCLKCHNDAVN